MFPSLSGSGYVAVMDQSSSPEQQAVPLSQVISAAADRIHYAEGRRTNFTVVAGALLAGGVAILTFIPDKNLSHVLAYFALSASAGAIMLGLLLLIVYARQTNRYPWTSATSTWKWFYRDALPDQQKFDWTWQDLLCPEAEKKRLQAEFDRQLPLFADKIAQLTVPEVSVEQDVQQLYVLHINDKFKNSHLSQLRTLLSRGLIAVAFLAITSGILGWQIDSRRTALHETHVRQGALELNTKWRFVSPVDKEGLVIATVTLANYGTTKAELPRWTFLDERGVRVPAVETAASGSPTDVPAGRRIRYTVLIKPAEAVPVGRLVATLP
jgi:hypothetical protein